MRPSQRLTYTMLIVPAFLVALSSLAINSDRAYVKASTDSRESCATKNSRNDALQGEPAVDYLKQHGLFDRIKASVEASRYEISAAYPGASIYRFIPNMNTEVRRGVLCYVPGPGASEGPEDEILALMGRAGAVIPLADEPLIEPAMALMSCGPAFMAFVAESFAEAGAAHGLDPDDAMRMVVETMGGTADYLARHDYDGPELRARVATPGGVTEKGLNTLEERGLRDVCRAAVDTVVEATR